MYDIRLQSQHLPPASLTHTHTHTHTPHTPHTHTHTQTHTRTHNSKLRRWIRLCWHNKWRFSNFEMRIFFAWVFLYSNVLIKGYPLSHPKKLMFWWPISSLLPGHHILKVPRLAHKYLLKLKASESVKKKKIPTWNFIGHNGQGSLSLLKKGCI